LRFESTGLGRKDLKARNPGKKIANNSPSPILSLVLDDVPIRGRVVDLEGEPVPQAIVQLRFVNNTYARFAFNAVSTNAEGRFEIHGIGRDRKVRLVAKSDRTEFSVFFARTATVPTKTQTTRISDPFALDSSQTERNKVIYGAEFTHAVGPSTPLEGRITDATTGKPLSKVLLSGAQIGNYQVTPAQEELSAYSDQDGRYRLTGLPLGQNSLFASSSQGGYLKRRIQLTIADDKPVVSGDFSMTKGVLLSGQVTDTETGDPIPGRLSYYAAEGNGAFPRGASSTDFRTGSDGRFQVTVASGEGYLAFRSRRSGYRVGVLDEATLAKTSAAVPFVQTKTEALLPYQFHLIQSINVSTEVESLAKDLQLKRQPQVTAKLVDVAGKPVNGATIEEVLSMPLSGLARGSSPLELAKDVYQCREFTPGGMTDLIARHDKRGLIGRLSLSQSPRDAEMPIVMRSPDLANRVKIDRVTISDDCDVKLTMRPAATLRGRVVDKDGKPSVVRISGHGRPFKTDDGGRFELTMVLPDFPIRIQALHPNRTELLGTLFEEVILQPGEVRNLGDVEVKPNRQ
ncbi:MAG: carboxypeptidase regulatory-like domain-containing protein, partial [Planctomycetota bacterium]